MKVISFFFFLFLESTHSQVPVDAVMQDFACNGYICDDLNRYQQYQSALNFANTNNINTTLHSNRVEYQPQFNFNVHDVRNNFWKILPTHLSHTHPGATAAAAAAAAAAVNIDYNSNKKPQPPKRFNNGIKNDKYVS